MTGMKMADTLSKKGVDASIVIISGRHDQRTASDAVAAGAKHFLKKPFDPDALVDIVHGLLAK